MNLGGQLVSLRSGQPPQRASFGPFSLELAVPFAEWRAVSDPQCGGGLGGNGWLVMIERKAEP